MIGKDGLFTQFILTEEQLRAGLYYVENVRIPDDAIAMAGIRAAELGEIAEILFQKSFDDLDECYFAVLQFTEGFNVALKDHLGSPVKGVKIYTDPQGRKSRHRLADIMDAIHLTPDQLIWVARDLE